MVSSERCALLGSYILFVLHAVLYAKEKTYATSSHLWVEDRVELLS